MRLRKLIMPTHNTNDSALINVRNLEVAEQITHVDAQYDPVKLHVITAHEHAALSQILVGTVGRVDSSGQFTFEAVYNGISDLYKSLPSTVAVNFENPEFRTSEISLTGEQSAKAFVVNMLQASKDSWGEKYKSVLSAQSMGRARDGLLTAMVKQEQARTEQAVDLATQEAGLNTFKVPVSYEVYVATPLQRILAARMMNAAEQLREGGVIPGLEIRDLIQWGQILPSSFVRDETGVQLAPATQNLLTSDSDGRNLDVVDSQNVSHAVVAASERLSIEQLDALRNGASFEICVEGEIEVLATSQKQANEVATALAILQSDVSGAMQVMRPVAQRITSVTIDPYGQDQGDEDEDDDGGYLRER